MTKNSQASKGAGAEGPMRIGLALSGGGFRASLYHLGTIRYLEKAGIMPRVEVVSTVSGGSIIGAYYLIEMERKLRANPHCNRLVACDEIINGFAQLLRLNFRMRAVVFYPFYHPVQTLLALLRLRHSGDTMALELERHMFKPQLRVGDLPVTRGAAAEGEPAGAATKPAGTRLLINTTSLITGRRVVFTRESQTGFSAQLSRSDPNNISVARAVGASAAVPGLFKPLRIGNEVLCDGGVVDNQGLESLLDYFEITDPPELNLLPAPSRQQTETDSAKAPVFLIVSDGAGQFAERPAPTATRAQSAARSTGILQAANRRKVLKLLLDARDDVKSRLAGFAFTHLAMNVKGPEGAGSKTKESLPSEFVGPTAELRTDLDDFSRLERDALIYHGYTLMEHQTERWGKKLLQETQDTAPGQPPASLIDKDKLFTWPPPFVALCDPSAGHEQRATTARFKIQRFLRIGATAAFRDIHRFPWTFAGLLAFFLILGRGFAYLLTDTSLGDAGQTVRDMLRDRIHDLVVGLIPQIDIPFVIDLTSLERMFSPEGKFFGTIDFLASLICVVLAFYTALWLYWEVKCRLQLPGRREHAMLETLRNMPEEGTDSTPTAQSKVTAAQNPTADSAKAKATEPGEATAESN